MKGEGRKRGGVCGGGCCCFLVLIELILRNSRERERYRVGVSETTMTVGDERGVVVVFFDSVARGSAHVFSCGCAVVVV